MRSAAEPATLTCHAGIAAVPPEALALFGDGLFLSPRWFAAVEQTAMPASSAAVFGVVSDGGRPVAVLPMLRHRGGLSSLTTPYSCDWRPIMAARLDAQTLRRVGRALGAWWRRHATVRLDALVPEDAAWPPLIGGLRQAGLAALPFDHFGNWSATVPDGGWDAYLAARPGHLRETLRRRGKQLMTAGATLRIVHDIGGLADGVAAYEAVYAASWKQAEPYPLFNAALMAACAADGSLRLGLLGQGGQVLAAQVWVRQGAWAGVQKLAHDERHRATSPGTVLTGLMIRHLIEQDGVTTLDFGRGDDDYKQAWTDTRRQRGGLLLANPWRVSGAAAILRRRVRDKLKEGVLF